MKIRDLSTADVTAGNTPVIDFGSVIDPKDSSGRWAHLVGIDFAFSVTYTVLAADMPAAMPGYILASILQNVRLMAGGRDFIRNLNLAELWKLIRIRDRSWGQHGPATDVADANATATQALRVPIMFGPSGVGASRWGRDFDGAIPIAALTTQRDPTSGLRFTIGPATSPFTQGGQNFTVASSCSVSSATIYAHVVYDESPHVDAWLAEGFLETRQDFTYQQTDGGYLEMLAAAEEYNGTNWTGKLTTYSNIQVQAGGDYTERSNTYGNMAIEYNAESLYYVASTTQNAISESAPDCIPFIRAVPGEPRVALETGPVRVQFVRTNTSSLMLAFARTIQDDNMLRKIADACGLDPKFVIAGQAPTSKAKAELLAKALPSKIVGGNR